MSKLIKEIETALNMIEMLGEVLVSGVLVTEAELMNSVTGGILNIFPEIVDFYLDLDENTYTEEVTYWANQMERVIEAVKGKDRFFLFDVLCYETKENLMDFKEHAISGE